MKNTPQRLAIMEYLEGNTSHPSAEQIHQALAGRFPTMALATVYNTLELLRGRRMVAELSLDAERKRFDPDVSDHHHAICTGCGRILDIRMPSKITLTEEILAGFEVEEVRLEVRGLCPDCRG